MIDKNQIAALLERPSEGLQVEVKTWLDPRADETKAKLVKALFAIRNRNGGYLVIGFNNGSHKPDDYLFSEPVQDLYHVDEIQGLVSRYSSIPFEVSVAYGVRDGQTHPVIVVPNGVRIPTVVKRSLSGEGGRKLLQEGDVYFRTLQSNGTPSSANLSPADWPDLLDICFENREADIGRFLRRHLPGLSGKVFGELSAADPEQEMKDRVFALIEDGAARSKRAAQTHGVTDELERTQSLLTMRVGLAIRPPNPNGLPTHEFMNKIAASNPQYTGWPVWLDSRDFYQEKDRAVVVDGAWEALIVDLNDSWSSHFEYLRFDPKGNFFLQRVMQDDLSEKVLPGTAMDVVLMLYRVAEVIAVGLSIGNALESGTDSTACFAFMWSGLSNRKLSSWADPLRLYLGPSGGYSRTAEARSFLTIPLDTPHDAIAPYVEDAVAPLFSCFDGYTPSKALVETCVRKLIDRKID